MNLRQKAPLIVISIAVLTVGLSTVSSYLANTRLIASAKEQELQTTSTVIEESIASQIGKAAARASMIASFPSVQEALRRQSREDLVKRLVPAFLEQREQFGVREGQFHLPPAISFLRVFDINAGHGEDLSSFREMVVACNKTQTLQKGIEVGRRGLSIRGVAPIRDAQGPIGSFEVGMDFTSVLQDVKRTTGFESAVFIDDALMAKVASFIPRPDNERIIGGLQAVEATNWQAVREISSPALLKDRDKVSTHLPQLEGTEFGTVVVPVLDYKKQPIGCIVATRSFEEYQTQARWALASMLSMAFLQALLLAAVLMVLINALIVAPVGSISQRIASLFKGTQGESLQDLTGKDDEIGSIARSTLALEEFIVAKRQSTTDSGKE